MNGAKGQYRTKGGRGKANTAFVKDRSISFDIDEQTYRWRGYEPDFDDLPWKKDLPATSVRSEATSRRSK